MGFHTFLEKKNLPYTVIIMNPLYYEINWILYFVVEVAVIAYVI